MGNKRNWTLIVPGVKLRLRDEATFNVVNQIVETGIYPSVIGILLTKLSRDTSILNLSESPTDAKLSQTIGHLESVTKMMNELHTNSVSSNKKIMELFEVIESMQTANTVQNETLTEVYKMLSGSSEGLKIMEDFSKEIGKDIKTIIEDTTLMTAKEMSKLSTSRVETTVPSYVPSFPNEILDSDEEFEGDDLLASDVSDEEISKLINQLSQ